MHEFGLTPEPGGTDADLNDIETEYFERGGLFEILEDANGNLLGTVGLFPLDEQTVELRKMYFDKVFARSRIRQENARKNDRKI